jgi:hypothetical protein
VIRRWARLRLLVSSGWVVSAALLALIALADLVASIANGHYDAHFNRSPGALIVIAAIGAVVSLAALSAAIGVARRQPGRIGLRAGVGLTAATLVLILLYAVVSLASGPL